MDACLDVQKSAATCKDLDGVKEVIVVIVIPIYVIN